MEDMEQFAEMMKAMQAGQGKGDKKTVGDRRDNYRFADPNTYKNKYGDLPWDGPYTVMIGQDPLDKEIKGTSWKKLNVYNWQLKHFLRHRHDPNFNPVQSILGQPNWTVEEKVSALNVSIGYGADINKSNSNFETPLRRALYMPGGMPLVTTLLDNGAKVDGVDSKGNSLLFDAILSGKPETIPLFLRKGVSVSKRADGLTLKDTAIQQFMLNGDLKTWFSTMAHLKKHKLYEGKNILEDKDKELFLENIRQKNPENLPFVKTLFQALDKIENNGEVLKTPTVRKFTNPTVHMESNYKGNYINHPWYDHFPFSIVRDIEKSMDDGQREHQVKMGVTVIEKMVNDPNYLISQRKEWILKHRNRMALDFILPNDPYGDCLLTKAARKGDTELLKFALQLNLNLNAKDNRGNSVLHLLTENIKNIPETDIAKKREYFELITQLVGLPDGKERKSLFEHGGYGDWFISDSEGKTFLDQLKEHHPLWEAELRKHLGIPEENIVMNIIVDNPTKALEYDPRLSRSPEKMPVVEELSAIATPEERKEKVNKIENILVEAYDYLNTESNAEKKEKIKANIIENLSKTESDVKVAVVFGLMSRWNSDDMQDPSYKALEGLLSNIAVDMQQHDKRQQIFEVFDYLLANADENGKNIKEFQNMVTQAGILNSNNSLITLGKKIEAHLTKEAEIRYGAIDENQKPEQGLN